MKIVFVCTDNIGRSVIAEYSLRDYIRKNNISGVEVSSAGIHANSDITGFSMAQFPELKKLGIDASKHVRTQLTQEIIDNTDRLVIFDFPQQEWIRDHFHIEVPLFNEIYKNEKTPINISRQEFSGSRDDMMREATHYIYDAIPAVAKKLIN